MEEAGEALSLSLFAPRSELVRPSEPFQMLIAGFTREGTLHGEVGTGQRLPKGGAW